MNVTERSIREEAVERTYLEMLNLYPDQKKLLDIIRKIKLEKLQNAQALEKLK